MRILAAVLFLLFAAAASAPSDPAILKDALDRAMKGTTAPAMGILEIRDGRVAGEAVMGRRRIDRPDPVRLSDRWHLGSDTKPMTATLIARLVDQGKLSWTARLDEMLPELATTMRPEYRDVTLADLLSHRSGMVENAGDEAFFQAFYDDRRPLPEQRMAYVRQALSEAPAAPKRAAKAYSNAAYILLGALAERAAGKPYEQLMRDEIFRPLGMKTASFDYSPDQVRGHVDGRLADRKFDPNPPMLNPAGQAQMTLRDWAKFCIDALNGAKGRGRLLKPQTYRLMQSGQGDTRNGLGWGVPLTVLGRQGPALTHSGSDGNWNALVVLFTDSDNGVLVVANAAESMVADKASSALIRERAATLAPAAPVPAS